MTFGLGIVSHIIGTAFNGLCLMLEVYLTDTFRNSGEQVVVIYMQWGQMAQ